MNTTDDLVAAIIDKINRTGGLTLGEIGTIAAAAGMTVEGDLVFGVDERNVWFYFDVSAEFIDLILRLRSLTEPRTLSALDVLSTGHQVSALPLARQLRRRYKRPHWLPIQLCPAR